MLPFQNEAFRMIRFLDFISFAEIHFQSEFLTGAIESHSVRVDLMLMQHSSLISGISQVVSAKYYPKLDFYWNPCTDIMQKLLTGIHRGFSVYKVYKQQISQTRKCLLLLSPEVWNARLCAV